MTSSEASSSKASHQKLKITRSCSSSEDARLKASKVVQWTWRQWMLVLWRALTTYNCTKCTTTTSTTQFLSLLQDKNNSSACNNVPTDLEWIWNWSFIGQPYQAKDHWWLIKASNDSYLDTLAIHNVFFTPLYKGVKTWRIRETHNNLKRAKPLLKLFCIKKFT